MDSVFNSKLPVYPCAWFIYSEIMWSMYSVAMRLSYSLKHLGLFYCFDYGVPRIIIKPKLKKPPDKSRLTPTQLDHHKNYYNNILRNKKYRRRFEQLQHWKHAMNLWIDGLTEKEIVKHYLNSARLRLPL